MQNNIILNMQINIKRLIGINQYPYNKTPDRQNWPNVSWKQCSRFVKAATKWAWFVMLMPPLDLANGYCIMYNYNNK